MGYVGGCVAGCREGGLDCHLLFQYVEVQPNDGFGTLLPLEAIELDVLFSPHKAFDYKFELVCKSLINR